MVKRILALSLLMVGLAGCGSGDGGDAGPAARKNINNETVVHGNKPNEIYSGHLGDSIGGVTSKAR